ncbi:MAG: uracil phosphoribosyltransferase [Chloroflexi bacterium]|nr:uracil phosphoribosyltransferase [Chloroflexota bacterium]
MSTVHVSNHPLLLHKLTKLRATDTDPKKFRELIREISILLAYEATADLSLQEEMVTTPLQQTKGFRLKETFGLVPVLRAGLGMVEGIWEMMPAAEVWHIGLYRDHATLEPVKYYSKLPVAPTVDVCLILDPMLATGGTAVAASDLLKKWGARKIKYIGLIAAPEGIAKLQSAHPDVPIYVAAIDERLTDSRDKFPPGYILPGLGDAGDRQFGTG